MTSSAALQGASLAFHKRKPSAPAGSTSPSRSHGALTAATLSAQSTGTSTASHQIGPDKNLVASRLQQLGHGQQHHLQPPGNKGHDGKNASFIAATLAASRSVSPSPRRRISAGSLTAVEEREKVVDEESIGTAGSLISMFEGGKRPEDRVDEDELERTPKRPKSQNRSLTPSPALASASNADRIRSERSPRREDWKGIPSKLAPNGLPPKPSTPVSSAPRPIKPSKLAVRRSLTPPPKFQQRGATRGEWPLNKDTTGPDPPFGNPELRTSKTLKPSPRPITPPPKPLVESQPRTKDRTPRVVDENNKKPKSTSESPQGLSRKPSKPPKPAPSPGTPPNDLPSRQPQVESVSFNQRKQSPSKPPAVRTPQKPVTVDQGATPKAGPSKTKVLSPQPLRSPQTHLPPPTTPQYQRGISRPAPELSPGDPQKNDTSSKPQPPTPPKPRGSNKITRTPTASSRHGASRPKTSDSDRKASEADSTNEVFVSAPTSPDYGSSPPLPLRQQTTSKSSPSPTRLSIYGRRPSHAASSSNLNLDSLTSAVMAGSLAASRLTPSNTGSSLPPPPRQKSPRLRQTMRKTVESSDSEDYTRQKGSRRAKLRSGKHAHHEGSRKRWREEIRPRERKRYEAVWASNRGLHLPNPSSSTHSSSVRSGKQPDYSGYVANVVVRDIWRRSRLPEDELSEVWDLVDREKRGMLGRAEFVVGMWLIDQRLRGRKIPTKVSDSVWGSANGVRVSAPKHRR